MKIVSTFAFLLLVSFTRSAEVDESRPSSSLEASRRLKRHASETDSAECPTLKKEDAEARDCHPPKRFDVGFKRGGTVLHSLSIPTIDSCVHKCKTHSNCTAINYNTNDGVCEMIVSSSTVTEVPEITSSLVKAECKDICYSANVIYGYIRKGHDRYVFDAYVVKSAEACCSYCSMLPYCVAWDYLHTHKICHLKNGIPDLEEGTHHGEVYTGFGCAVGEAPQVNDVVVI